ncbi:MAG: transporter [Verrucomicrobia bacterium]|jgi:manganese/zinc/iron transport system permease protein|nr:transporter [Verrucomicrobiota bacterium]
MSELIPPFDWQQHVIAPWVDGFGANFLIALMGFFVATACGLVGNYLMMRRMALVGDAISHSVLPGIAVAFLWSKSRGTWPMFIGALIAGIVTTILIEVIHKKSRVKQDAAIGIAFTSLFAIGVILISVFASQIDLDQECVLYGEIGYIGAELPPDFKAAVQADGFWQVIPVDVSRMGLVTLATVLLVTLFYKQLLVSSFDAGLATSLGINSTFVHYALMCWLSIVVVSAFESVGAVLVVAMLILPGATAFMLSHRLPVIHALTVLVAALSSVLGVHLATWLDCSMAGAMVVMASVLFTLAWVFSPLDGLLVRFIRQRKTHLEPSEEIVEATK